MAGASSQLPAAPQVCVAGSHTWPLAQHSSPHGAAQQRGGTPTQLSPGPQHWSPQGDAQQRGGLPRQASPSAQQPFPQVTAQHSWSASRQVVPAGQQVSPQGLAQGAHTPCSGLAQISTGPQQLGPQPLVQVWHCPASHRCPRPQQSAIPHGVRQPTHSKQDCAAGQQVAPEPLAARQTRPPPSQRLPGQLVAWWSWHAATQSAKDAVNEPTDQMVRTFFRNT